MSGEEQAAGTGAQGEQASGAPGKPSDDGGGTEKAAAVPAGGGSPNDTLKLGADEMIKRRSRWQSSLAALRYVSSISQDNEVQLRDSDRATSLWLVIVCILAALSIILPQFASPGQPQFVLALLQWMASNRTVLVLAADALVGVGLVLYVANRFGILTTLTPRQALLTWHLVLGSSLIGIFLTINLFLLCWVVYSPTKVVIPEAHPQASGVPAGGRPSAPAPPAGAPAGTAGR